MHVKVVTIFHRGRGKSCSNHHVYRIIIIITPPCIHITIIIITLRVYSYTQHHSQNRGVGMHSQTHGDGALVWL